MTGLCLPMQNCLPESNQWLRTMARNFTSRAQIVLGYSGYERGKGWLHKRVSFDNLFTSMRYLGYALAGKPYMGIGRNMAYRKELFYAQKGFSAHLNLQRGDDDLFINKTATGREHEDRDRCQCSGTCATRLPCQGLAGRENQLYGYSTFHTGVSNAIYRALKLLHGYCFMQHG